MTAIFRCLTALTALVLLEAAPAAAQKSFVEFESGPVRPLAMSPSGNLLFAVNTPDNRLEIFRIDAIGLLHLSSVPVGMEPVAVAARSDSEVWVVNHLSDSVSIVDVGLGASPRVVKTLLVGDEPRDIVFAGPGSGRAFITAAHRGQHRSHASIASAPGAGDPQLTTPGVGRADVWVFDAANPGAEIGGKPIRILELFGDTPRALAVSADGGTVYAAVFLSGNQTAVVSEGMVCDGFTGAGACAGDGVTSPGGLPGGNLPGGTPGPGTNFAGAPAPETGLVVRFDPASGEWRDALGRNWSNGVRFSLPDKDVFAIDATSLAETAFFPGVGTILFNMVVNPLNGNVYVSNSEAPNLTRFEGPGAFGGSTVQGHLSEARITLIEAATGLVKPRHLNPHIDYNVLPAPPGVKNHSLATPLQMVLSSDAATLYVAAFGSSKIGVLRTADLENDALWDGAGMDFDPTLESAGYIAVSGGGPAGLVLDESRGRLYVATRFDNAVAVVDLASAAQQATHPLHNPEPAIVVAGRHMLYDAFKTSSNGETSCSSCHVFADFDSLAWDLGNPDAGVSTSPLPIRLEIGAGGNINGTGNPRDFHPMKGPMTTQTLRGVVNHGAMHWRGDRSNGFFGVDTSPNFDDADLSFRNFIVAMEGLVGSEKPPSDPALQADMQLFADFALEIVLPPNPVRSLDNALDAGQQAGRDFYLGNVGPESVPGQGHFADGVPFAGFGFTCQGCHTLNPGQGHFGGNGFQSFEGETQIIKIPHLRNLYQKVGMFGMPNVAFNGAGDSSHQGDQVRGTGFLHDGSTDSLFRFFSAVVFDSAFGGTVGFTGGDPQRREVESFMLAFDSDLAPVVGQQVTLVGAGNADVSARIALMETSAGTAFSSLVMGGGVTECDLVVKGRVAGEDRGYLYDPGTARYGSDRASEAALSGAALRGLAQVTGQELTFTCAPPGSGPRMGLDRDEDGVFDRDELDAGTDPALPGNFTGACSNGLDDDGDGLADLADPGCANAGSDNESPQCNDAVDNDRDGLVDLADPQCSQASVDREQKRKRRCGAGVELALVLPLLWAARRRRTGRNARARASVLAAEA